MTSDEFGGKPMFFDGENYLFSKVIDGVSKWIIADQTEGGTIIGEVESWAQHPADIEVVSPYSLWQLDDYGDKVTVEPRWVKTTCADYDHGIHISSPKNSIIDGFYQYRTARLNDHATFQNGDLYLYRISSHNRYERWMISHEYGSDSGVAYMDNAKDLPHNTESSWQVTTANGWQLDHALKMTRSMFTRSSWRSLMHRRQKEISETDVETFVLRNGMKLPKVLLDARKAQSAFNLRVAFKNKYRLFLVNENQLTWTREFRSPGRSTVTALRIKQKDPESILTSINNSRKLRGYVDCAVLDVGEMSAAEITPAWNVLEKAYADGLVLCVGSTNGDSEKNKVLASRPLPPHFMIFEKVDKSFNDFLETKEDKNIVVFFNNELEGDFFGAEKKNELAKIAKTRRSSIQVVNSAWARSHGYGASFTLNPSSSLPDAGRISQFEFEDSISFKDEL